MTPQRFCRDQRRSIRRHTEEPSPDGHLSPWLWRPGYTASAAQDGRRDRSRGRAYYIASAADLGRPMDRAVTQPQPDHFC